MKLEDGGGKAGHMAATECQRLESVNWEMWPI
jgi:hypothetical protein